MNESPQQENPNAPDASPVVSEKVEDTQTMTRETGADTQQTSTETSTETEETVQQPAELSQPDKF